MDLSTPYLGLTLRNPLMPGAGPLCDDLDTARRLEDAGAAALVMRSLFEEQVTRAEVALLRELEGLAGGGAPRAPAGFQLGPHEYLEQLRRLKAAVTVPVIASINGTSEDARWLEYARWIEAAGADALELNAYHMATDPFECAAAVEQRLLDLLAAVRGQVTLPIAVKLGPYHSALPHLARALVDRGAAGLVLFNRFYQPDIDVQALEVVPSLQLSDPSELPLRVRWLAVLSPLVDCSLACSGGVHGPLDAVKAVLAGAHAVQMTSALLLHGPERLGVVLDGLRAWLEERGHASLADVRGSMSRERCPNPQALERADYVRLLHTWHRRRA
ncbi:MAG: dihydroorotate dehydrogenase-like protein [Planctomycetes bacterium]|nr:dihydroorotate dehydrogenase-like protein [Planctomycetota bacterium]